MLKYLRDQSWLSKLVHLHNLPLTSGPGPVEVDSQNALTLSWDRYILDQSYEVGILWIQVWYLMKIQDLIR